VGGDVVQDPAHIVFIISKKPTVPSLRSFCFFTTATF
jgi:hypothetical protein